MTGHRNRSVRLRMRRRGAVWLALLFALLVAAGIHAVAVVLLLFLAAVAYGVVLLYRHNARLNAGRQQTMVDAWQEFQRYENSNAEPVGEAYPRERYRTSRYIPQSVRIAVAVRDRGRCRDCGSTEDLQYDHIFPYSLDGPSTVENLCLRCGPCNRAKAAKVM